MQINCNCQPLCYREVIKIITLCNDSLFFATQSMYKQFDCLLTKLIDFQVKNIVFELSFIKNSIYYIQQILKAPLVICFTENHYIDAQNFCNTPSRNCQVQVVIIKMTKNYRPLVHPFKEDPFILCSSQGVSIGNLSSNDDINCTHLAKIESQTLRNMEASLQLLRLWTKD